MKIYTKHGDAGDTGLIGGVRVRKSDARIEAYGTVDELNAVLGTVRAAGPPEPIDEVLARLQHELFDLGAELAARREPSPDVLVIRKRQIERLEGNIDHFESGLAPLRQFILPAGTPVAAGLHLARTVCRRAERAVVQLVDGADEPVSPEAIIYLNRLSDLLFVLARSANAEAHKADMPWRQEEV